MQVQRLEFDVRRGCLPEALTLVKEMLSQPGILPVTRVYTSRIGQQNMLALELEWESLAAYEKGWATWNAHSQAAAFFKRWDEVVEKGAEEIWESVAT